MNRKFNARQALEAAVKYFNGGRAPMAADLCREVLDLDPKNANASYLLGVISHQTGQGKAAIDLISKSLKHEPRNAEAHNYLGVALVDAGRQKEAEKCFRRAIENKKGFPEAYNNLGNVLMELGRLDEAVANFRKALSLRPDYSEAYNSLGCSLRELGRLEDAAASIKKAIAGDRNHYEAHNNLGDVFRDLGRYDEAAESYRNAVSSKPDFAEAHNNLGLMLLETGRQDDAAASFRKVIDIKPDYAGAHNNLGIALMKAGMLDDASSSFRKSIGIDPDLAEPYNNLGNALFEYGRIDDAIANFRQAIDIKPDYAEAYDNLGFSLMEAGQLNDAIVSFRKAIEINQDFAQAYNNLGFALMETGQLDDAVTNFRKAIDIKPDYAAAHRHLAHLKKHTSSNDTDIRKMEQIFSGPDTGDDQKKHLAFALGKSFEDLRQYDKAFEFFLAGNTINRSTFHYDVEEWSAYVKRLKAVFDDTYFSSHKATGYMDETPIFILGMLRSGTTLVEQILASHPNVYGAGELDTLSTTLAASLEMENFPGEIQHMGNDVFERLGSEYIRAIRLKSGKTPFITDKMPGNFKYIGMIKQILPKAKIIHCKRSPQDNCLSIFKNYFPMEGHKYAYDMSELGQYYKIYRELMEHWHGVLPGLIHDIHYEEIVADQEGQTRALLDHCGLEWNDACMQFHKTDRPVRTLSTAQVRRPIYKDSVQLWKRYEEQLAPLIESLR